jgi:hypothetical protein
MNIFWKGIFKLLIARKAQLRATSSFFFYCRLWSLFSLISYGSIRIRILTELQEIKRNKLTKVCKKKDSPFWVALSLQAINRWFPFRKCSCYELRILIGVGNVFNIILKYKFEENNFVGIFCLQTENSVESFYSFKIFLKFSNQNKQEYWFSVCFECWDKKRAVKHSFLWICILSIFFCFPSADE